MAKIKTAEVLAFERKLANSDGLMYSGLWEKASPENLWQPIGLQKKSVRGTISNRQKNAIASDPLKLDAEVKKPNLQTVDTAALPFEHDSLQLSFTLRVLGELYRPSVCNSPEYQALLENVVKSYIQEFGFSELALRYATNLANGRFLWRNRVGAEEVKVVVEHIAGGAAQQRWIFNGSAISLREFSADNKDVKALASTIASGLLGEKFTFLKVNAYARMGNGQEVFPSEELILDSGSAKGSKSKTLYHINNIAGLHSQKIGNALRTVDTWYEGADEFGPISVEPFGSVTSRGVAYRQPNKKMDFYSLFDNWVTKDKTPEPEQQHYVMATLIRGGVFGERAE